MRVVYEDDRLIVSTNDVDAPTVIFSFSAWTKVTPAPAFGADFITKHQFRGIFFQSKTNDWWRNESMPAALAAAAQLATGATRRIAFGSSMGAFGALVFGPILQCTDYVAISPQASIDRAHVPWETRWAAEAAEWTPNPNIAGTGVPSGGVVHLIYDHLFLADRRHVELIADLAQRGGADVQHWRFGLSGHPTGQALVHTGQLSRLIVDIFERQGDHAATIRVFREKRRASRAVALTLLTNRRLLDRHPKLVWKAVARAKQSQTFDEKLNEMLDKLDSRLQSLAAVPVAPAQPRVTVNGNM
jgi:hypothetical protein